MSDLLRSNFGATMPAADPAAAPTERELFRKRALENISGSMVFVEDALLWWDLADE